MTPLEYAAKIAYSSEETLLFSYKMARKFKDSPGVFVECGVAAGAQVIAMAYGAPDKTIYAFDSFEGIPLPSNRDDQMPGISMLSKTEQMMLPSPGKQVLESSGATVVSMESFLDHLHSAIGIKLKLGDTDCLIGLENASEIIVVKGWFENTVAKLNNDISILRLDGDLYNSTWVCLQHLFPKVIQGGCVIVDDWTLPGCQAACKEYFALIGYEPDYKFLSTISYFYK